MAVINKKFFPNAVGYTKPKNLAQTPGRVRRRSNDQVGMFTLAWFNWNPVAQHQYDFDLINSYAFFRDTFRNPMIQLVESFALVQGENLIATFDPVSQGFSSNPDTTYGATTPYPGSTNVFRAASLPPGDSKPGRNFLSRVAFPSVIGFRFTKARVLFGSSGQGVCDLMEHQTIQTTIVSQGLYRGYATYDWRGMAINGLFYPYNWIPDTTKWPNGSFNDSEVRSFLYRNADGAQAGNIGTPGAKPPILPAT